MKKHLIIFFLLKNILLGCALCSIYSPQTDVSIHLKADKDEIKTAKINWVFARPFTDELLKLYDLNLDKNFNKKELALIEESLLAYIEPKNFLTFISYSKNMKMKTNPINVKNYKLEYKKGILSFSYNLDLNYKIVDKYKLFIEINDEEGYFIMFFDPKKQLFNVPYKFTKVINSTDISYIISAPGLIEKNIDAKEEKEEIQEKPKISLVEKSIEKTTALKDITLLDKFTNTIKKYLVDIEKGEDKFALAFLLLASFVYGMIHALGPGHGKALAFSYFSAQKSSYSQALVISFLTAFIHILGAFLLVLISVFILQSVLNSFIEDSISYLTSLCAVLIMFLSIYILYRKLKKKSCVCSSCSIDVNTIKFSTNSNNQNFVKSVSNKPIINTKERKKQDLFFVITAGLVPCPGTVLLFVYAFILQTYFSVILASIAISLGMGIVIFISSFLGLSLNKVSRKSHKITNIIEIIAPIFMFFLGVLLLFSVNI